MNKLYKIICFWCLEEPSAPTEKSVQSSEPPVAPPLVQKTSVASLTIPFHLELTVLESETLSKGLVLHIAANKLAEPESQTIAGLFEITERLGEGGTELDSSNTPKKPAFRIAYCPRTSHYYLKDMGHGTGTFVKVQNYTFLEFSSILSFGHNHLAVNLSEEEVVIHCIEGSHKGQSFSFGLDEKILVGRVAECQVRFEDQNFSRIQCSIEFVPENGLKLVDGDGRKQSLNGTWRFVDSDMELVEGMIFKAGQNLFQVRLVKNESV